MRSWLETSRTSMFVSYRDIQKNKEEQRENIVTSGNLFIRGFTKVLKDTPEFPEQLKAEYLQRVLHSIFFFGHINRPPVSPKEFIAPALLQALKNKFPKPFEEYNTHLPKQTPYSILLEYMATALNSEDPDVFVNQLVRVNVLFWKLKGEEGNQPVANDFAFSASVIAYSCYKDKETNTALQMAYGSSISCKGKVPRQVMIAISALHVWDKAIAYAVCCGGNSPVITFPKQIHCYAYQFNCYKRMYKKIPPCTKCDQIFKDVQFNPSYSKCNKKEEWPYGNCAETESLSKLLLLLNNTNDTCKVHDREGRQINRNEIENKFREEHEGKMRAKVKKLLHARKFILDSAEWQFFTPA
ncbi:uncharacterized protein WCC33_015983 [Rhinophrynus dorsalis]